MNLNTNKIQREIDEAIYDLYAIYYDLHNVETMKLIWNIIKKLEALVNELKEYELSQ